MVGNGKEILKTAHFDTYAEGEIFPHFIFCFSFLNVNKYYFKIDSTNLEIFLESLYDNVILIVITFDEASQK